MNIIRFAVVVIAAIVAAPLLLAVVGAVAVVVATSRGADVTVPGLLHVAAGSGAELASVTAEGAGVFVWFAGVVTVLVLAEVARFRLRRRPDRVS